MQQGTATSRTQVWLSNFDPVKGHEQGRTRPSVIVSSNSLNHGPARMVIVVPMTKKDYRLRRMHVEIQPPEGGLTLISYAMTEQTRSISADRLIRPMGFLTASTMEEIELRLRYILEL
jgi:mRNA interferase MazF